MAMVTESSAVGDGSVIRKEWGWGRCKEERKGDGDESVGGVRGMHRKVRWPGFGCLG